MTDRELLELAAKAAWIEGEWGDNEHPGGEGLWDGCSCWNPLHSDEQALRLAVKLELHIKFYRKHVDVDADIRLEGIFSEETKHNPYAATRRAIVRAAAEIGRNEK